MLNVLINVMSANLAALVMKMISGFVFPQFMTTQAYADYQTFSLYLSYIPILSIGFPTGMFVQYGGRSFSQIDKARYKSEVHILVVILCFFTVLFDVIWLFVPNRMLLYMTLCILPYCLVCSYQSLYQAWGEFHKYTRTHVLTMAVPLLGSALLYLVLGKLEAEYFIFLFITIYVFYALAILYRAAGVTRSVVRTPYFDKVNLQTLKVGFSICIGNYINVLFHSVDKQFVKLIFDTTSFAQYSFGLSLQSIVMVFITSAAQPMYHFLASRQVDQKRYNIVMRLLLMLGTCAGIAYHTCRVVVTWLVPKYTHSLDVIAVYFAAFPAMAVINCLYINLYKLTKQTKQYVYTLAGVLLLSVGLNGLFVFCRWEATSITFATVIVYYAWLLWDARRFRSLHFGIRDGVFLTGYLAAYLISLQIPNAVPAAAVYGLLVVLVCITVYKNEVRFALELARQKLRN